MLKCKTQVSEVREYALAANLTHSWLCIYPSHCWMSIVYLVVNIKQWTWHHVTCGAHQMRLQQHVIPAVFHIVFSHIKTCYVCIAFCLPYKNCTSVHLFCQIVIWTEHVFYIKSFVFVHQTLSTQTILILHDHTFNINSYNIRTLPHHHPTCSIYTKLDI